MKIAGIEKCSFVDFPGHLAAVFFVPGCNWNCYYCHNRSLLGKEPTLLSAVEAFTLLEARHGLLDGVVVTGGEPTLQAGLADFVRRVRQLGYPVKLDTNGSRPKVLRGLIEEGLLSYVAMDLKAPMAKYEAVCGAPVFQDNINESIDLIMASGVDYEFRTTVAPQLTQNDLKAMARRISGATKYVLQQFRKPPAHGPHNDPRLDAPPHSASWFASVVEELGSIVQSCDTRGLPSEAQAASAA